MELFILGILVVLFSIPVIAGLITLLGAIDERRDQPTIEERFTRLRLVRDEERTRG